MCSSCCKLNKSLLCILLYTKAVNSMNSERQPKSMTLKLIRHWFPVSNRTRISRLNGGAASYNWKFNYNGKKYVLKVLEENKPKAELFLEYKIIKYIKESGFHYSIPGLLLSKNSFPFVKSGNKIYLIHEYIDGNKCNRITASEAKQIGVMIGELHSIIKSYSHNFKRSMGYHTISMLKKRFYSGKKYVKQDGSELYNLYMQGYFWFSEQIHKINLEYYRMLKVYPLHEDISTENILFKNGKVTALLDFSNIGSYRNPLIMDLAWAVHFCCKSKRSKLYDMGLIKALFYGYRTKMVFTGNDARAFISLVLLVEAATLISSYEEASKLPKSKATKFLRLHTNAAKFITGNSKAIEKAISE